MCDMNFDERMQTYLSPSVHTLLCEVGVVHRDTLGSDVERSTVLVDGLLDWSALASKLTVVSSKEEYVCQVHVLASLFREICDCYRDMSEIDFENEVGKYFKWTTEPAKAVRCFHVIQNETSTAVSHALLILTSVLERSLGDVVLLRATQCPSLLRDLLIMKELEELLSYSIVQLLQTLMGPPISLNLRNVVWHGFPRPGELDVQYVYVMLCVAASIGKLLKDRQIYEIPHRDFIRITASPVFLDVHLSEMNDVKQLFAHSAFVAPSVCPFWHLSLELFATCHYGECVAVLLPQMELALRRVFVAVNGCPDRILTAENTALYTTFDEILDKQLPDGSENQLVSAIGIPYMTLLLDCFQYPLGPRVRDHVSHGEVLLADVSKEAAIHLICICIALTSKFCSSYCIMRNTELVQLICTKADSYESVYHPISLVKQQTLLVSKTLSLWHLMPRPDIDQGEHLSEGKMEEAKVDRTHTESALRAVENYVSMLSAEDLIDKLDCQYLVKQDACVLEVEKLLHGVQLSTLYRYHSDTLHTREEELLRLLLRIGKLCVQISEQVLRVSERGFTLWQAKQMRSRQRTNYKKFLTSTLSISTTSRVIVIVTLITLKVLDHVKHDVVKQQKLVKLFKHIQKYCENMLGYTRTDTNKWDEAERASHDLSNRLQSFKLA